MCPKKESLLTRFLKFIGILKPYEIDKKKMCENAQSVCTHECEDCVWKE